MININQAINQNTNYGADNDRPDLDFTGFKQNHTIAGSGNCGYLIPILLKELMPNSSIRYRPNIAVQLEPTVTNITHKMYTKVIVFACPHRLVYPEISDFLFGGISGQEVLDWPTISISDAFKSTGKTVAEQDLKNTLWDYAGLPVWDEWSQKEADKTKFFDSAAAKNKKINMVPFMAYNECWNEHIRPIDQMEVEVPLESLSLQRDHWTFDRYTRGRRFQNRGAEVLIPFSDAGNILTHKFTGNSYTHVDPGGVQLQTKETIDTLENSQFRIDQNGRATSGFIELEDHSLKGMGVSLLGMYIAMGVQGIGLRNAKVRPLYVNYLKTAFGITPQDSRLQRPEYLGTQMNPINMDVVTQTSFGIEGTTQQGNITGQGYSLGEGNQSYLYKAEEWTTLVAMMVVAPISAYELGIQKKWTRESRFDMYDPLLANLPDVPIKNEELCFTTDETYNNQTFGYGNVWDEYRIEENYTVGQMRPSVFGGQGFTNLSRYWSTLDTPEAVENRPKLNELFVLCTPDMDRVLKVTDKNDFRYFINNEIEVVAPLPLQSDLLKGKLLGGV